jgi:GR25 family glycosyltransferase involved in LPS biosynthesis
MEREKTRRKVKLNIFNTPTYVVSLKERSDRWKRFIQQPAIHLLKRLKQSRAVNGKTLDPKNDSRISVRTRLNIFRNYRRSHYEIATLGAVGCSLSHIDIWNKFLKSGSKYCLILEDDAILTESVLHEINKVIPSLPKQWGIWILGNYTPNLIYQHLDTKPWNRIYNFTASHAYLINRETAKLLLESAYPVESHVDHYINAISVLKNIMVLQHPSVHVEFFKKEHIQETPARTVDSNTSQHKKKGCPTCKINDDFSQIYVSPSRKTKQGMLVKGLTKGMQTKEIRTLKKKPQR